jgi:hypothetical protein
MDQDQLFVISAINRKGIADNFNVFLDVGLHPTDPRLTDELCQAYADGLSSMDSELEYEEFHEAFYERYFSG